MATEKWIAGSLQAAFGDAFSTATLNSIVNGNAILSDIVIDNTATLDIFADVSIALGSITSVPPAFAGIYLYPLNKDAATYGDGRFGASAAGPPPSSYMAGIIGFPVGTAAIVGTCRAIILPPSKFKFVLYNQSGATLAGGSGNTCQFKSYNRSVA